MQRNTIEDKARMMVNKIILDPIVCELIIQIKSFDKCLFYHSTNVAFFVAQIVQGWDIPKDQQYDIVTAALLHDIGKITIPIDVLNKEDHLTMEEYQMIKTHVEEGEKILRDAGIGEKIVQYVAKHHENSDGSGYPKGLTAKEIGKEAMIIAAVDKYDALTSKRCYGEEFSADQAFRILLDEGNIPKKFLIELDKAPAY